MSTLKVSLVQTHQYWEDKQANLDHFGSKLVSLYHQTDLVLLPEMFDTAFSMNVALADLWTESKSLNSLIHHARHGNFAIYTSLMIRDSNGYFNRGVFVFPDGMVEIYDKQKLFTLAKENHFFQSGFGSKIVNYKDWKINLNICYDLRFPEIMRNEVLNDSFKYDVLLLVANWPQKRSEHWRVLLRARAIENQCFVLAVNRIGLDPKGLSYSGDSVVLDPLGKGSFLDEEETVTLKLEKSQLIEIRKQLPFLKDR
jgi:omega-amidase